MILKPTVLHFANTVKSQINAAAFNRDRISLLVEFLLLLCRGGGVSVCLRGVCF